jgi:DNA-binding MarR family transcriptional regulator
MVTNTTTPADDEVPWLTEHERGAWMTLIALLMSLPASIDTQLKRDSGLNFFEYSILSALSRRPGRTVRMNTLAQFAGGSASRLSHAVSRLERQGWVRREVHLGEVRCTEAMLTEKGWAVLTAAAPGHVREARRLVFDAITPEQAGQLRQIARQLLEASSPESAAALDQAIVEAAAKASGSVDAVGSPCAEEADQILLEAVAGSPCNEHLDETGLDNAALDEAAVRFDQAR